MSETMVERVAKAIEKTLLDCGALARKEQSDWTRGPALVAARAAIEAMMEPSPIMMRALARSAWHSGSGRKPEQVWRDVLDAALERGGPPLPSSWPPPHTPYA